VNRFQKQRLLSIFIVGFLFSVATFLIFYSLDQNLNLFYTPTDISEGVALKNKKIRLGGMVKKGSLERSDVSLGVSFLVTDFSADVMVSFNGILPDLFKEGQGIVSEGIFNGKIFIASEVLAKHDENYMPPEVSEALRRSGSYQNLKEKF